MQGIEPLMQFGVAGLMGVLWVWERALSRRRESQLDDAHRRLRAQRADRRVLMETIERNTRVIERFEQTQRVFIQMMERMSDERAGEQAARQSCERGDDHAETTNRRAG